MRLNLQLFGDTGKSGSAGAPAQTSSSGNKFEAERNYWKKQNGSGVAQMFSEFDRSAGGKLGNDIAAVPYEKVDRELRKILNTVQTMGGNENFYVKRTGLQTSVYANRTGLVWFSEYLKKYVKSKGLWY